MIDAFIGLTGRTDATHAALLLAELKGAVGRSVTLVRITTPGDANLPDRIEGRSGIHIVEREARATPHAIIMAVEEIQEAGRGRRDVVLDLPRGCAFDGTLRVVTDTVIHTVGPHPFDEHMATTAIHAAVPEAASERTPWLLGCGRGGGGPAALSFARRMTDPAVDLAPHVLPVVLPPLTRTEAARLVDGSPTKRTLLGGEHLLAALDAIAATPALRANDPLHLIRAVAAGVSSVGAPDERDLGDRLRDLGDELHAIRDGVRPTAEDLVDAPLLDDWRVVTKEVVALAGRVSGHPSVPDGRKVVTSEYHATGETWVRTMSRYYRLGRRAPREAESLMQ